MEIIVKIKEPGITELLNDIIKWRVLDQTTCQRLECDIKKATSVHILLGHIKPDEKQH